MSVPSPDEGRDWLLALLAAALLLTIHLAAALAAACRRRPTCPGATLRRWGRRSPAVLGLSLPVWVLLLAQSEAAPEGDDLLTYAALAALALLAFGFWQAGARGPAPGSPRGTRAPRGSVTRVGTR